MAYEKTTWQTGDVITAEKLNNMEGGIEAALSVFVISISDENVFDKTWNECKTAFDAGMIFALKYADPLDAVFNIKFPEAVSVTSDSGYEVKIVGVGVQAEHYVAESADGYPTLQTES